ncbi:MAG: GGDEF domain-containing protein, partial [Candidatus Aminicenantes bacterium]|nr:GGDEF domain-containing protein [Candidatus Aminicenantes bacterium]
SVLRKPSGKTAGRRGKENGERYRALLEHLPVGIYRTTPEGRIVEFNRALGEILGAAKPADLLRVNVRNLYVKARDRDEHLRRLEKKPIVFKEFEFKRLDGSKVWVRDHPRAVKDARGRIVCYDGIIVDITARKRAEKQLHKALTDLERANKKYLSQSLTDDLTRLYNRRGFFSFAQQLFRIAKRVRNPLCLVFLDIDNLKVINDTWGHKEGDRALFEFGNILKETFRESDVIGRVGGDEFAVLVLLPTRDQGRLLLERLQDRLEAFNRRRRKKFSLEASMGVVWCDPEQRRSLQNLLMAADRRMYWNKQRKSRTRLFPSTLKS